MISGLCLFASLMRDKKDRNNLRNKLLCFSTISGLLCTFNRCQLLPPVHGSDAKRSEVAPPSSQGMDFVNEFGDGFGLRSIILLGDSDNVTTFGGIPVLA